MMSGTASSPIILGSDSTLVRFIVSPSPIKTVNRNEQYRLVSVLNARHNYLRCTTRCVLCSSGYLSALAALLLHIACTKSLKSKFILFIGRHLLDSPSGYDLSDGLPEENEQKKKSDGTLEGQRANKKKCRGNDRRICKKKLLTRDRHDRLNFVHNRQLKFKGTLVGLPMNYKSRQNYKKYDHTNLKLCTY